MSSVNAVNKLVDGSGHLIDVSELRKAAKLLNALDIPVTIQQLIDVVTGKAEIIVKHKK